MVVVSFPVPNTISICTGGKERGKGLFTHWVRMSQHKWTHFFRRSLPPARERGVSETARKDAKSTCRPRPRTHSVQFGNFTAVAFEVDFSWPLLIGRGVGRGGERPDSLTLQTVWSRSIGKR